MMHDRPPRWPLVLALSLMLVLPACRSGSATPTATAGATPTRRATPGSPTLRGTVVVPRPAGTVRPTTGAPQLGIAPVEGTLLVDQAVGLLLDYSLNRPTSADLYQAAYDGALRAIARGGLLVNREPLPLGGDRGDDAPTFRTAYRALAELVRADIDQTTLAYAAIRAAVDRADQCQTYFLDPAGFRQAREGQPAADGNGGIGVTLGSGGDGVVVGAVYADSPAARAGLLPGDRVLAVDGSAVANRDAEMVVALLRGAIGTTVQLTIQRPGEGAPRTVSVTRAAVRPPAFTATIVARPGGQMVALVQLADVSVEDLPSLRAALAGLAGRNPRGWVLDLRGTSVGPLDLLPQLGSLFVPQDQPLGYVVAAGREETAIAPDRSSPVAPVAPLAVLIDSGTTLLGEALAAAARDSAAARLFGEPTAGCVATSALYPLTDDSGLRITLDPLLSPQHRPLHGTGQRPDETILPDPTGATDPVLAAALRWLSAR
ncbi:MAG: S41 family peptidase [Thermomicrobiales bacterium]